MTATIVCMKTQRCNSCTQHTAMLLTTVSHFLISPSILIPTNKIERKNKIWDYDSWHCIRYAKRNEVPCKVSTSIIQKNAKFDMNPTQQWTKNNSSSRETLLVTSYHRKTLVNYTGMLESWWTGVRASHKLQQQKLGLQITKYLSHFLMCR